MDACVFLPPFQWQSWKMFSCELPKGPKLQHNMCLCQWKKRWNEVPTKHISSQQCIKIVLKHNSRGLVFLFFWKDVSSLMNGHTEISYWQSLSNIKKSKIKYSSSSFTIILTEFLQMKLKDVLCNIISSNHTATISRIIFRKISTFNAKS